MCVLLTVAFVREIRLAVHSPPSVLVWIVAVGHRDTNADSLLAQNLVPVRPNPYLRNRRSDIRRQNGGVSYSDGRV